MEGPRTGAQTREQTGMAGTDSLDLATKQEL